jgi:hypothetical protein
MSTNKLIPFSATITVLALLPSRARAVKLAQQSSFCVDRGIPRPEIHSPEVSFRTADARGRARAVQIWSNFWSDLCAS